MSRILLRDLTPGTDYVIQLRTDAGDSVSEWSRLFEVSTSSDVVPPDVPQLISPVADSWKVDGDTFVGEWLPLDFNLDNNKDFDHYEIELSNGIANTVVSTNNTTYVLTFEQNRIFFGSPAATVEFRVRSVDLVGNVSAWTAVQSETNPAPAPIANLTTTELYDSIDVSWDASTEDDFKNYLVQVSTTGVGGSYTSVYSGTNNAYTHKTTQFATDHFFKVFVLDKFGTISTSVTSSAARPKSTFSSDTTPPTFTGPVEVGTVWESSVQSSTINVSWDASVDTDIGMYEVRWSATDGSDWRYRTVGRDVLETRIDGVQSGVSYYIGVRAIDFSGNPSSWVNATEYPITANFDNTAPSKPAPPTVSITVDALKLQVNHDGQKASGGPLEPDTELFKVHASRTSGFTVSQDNLIGTMKFGFAASQVFMVPAEGTGTATTDTWYVRVVAVDYSGNFSSLNASDEVAATVGLIETANIGYAQITDAKISDLTVDKLTAGTGLATDFTIKSTLTLGEVGNDGVIMSHDYDTSGGTQGFSLDSDGLIIKTGSIEAAALKIQSGPNIIRPEYASFETSPDALTPLLTAENLTWDVAFTSKFGGQSLSATWSLTSPDIARLWLGQSDTDYNIPVEASNTYIFSGYFWNEGVVDSTISLKVKWSDGTSSTIVSDTLIAGTTSATSSRLNGAVAAPVGVSGAVLYIESSDLDAGASFNVDGIQVEYRIGSESTPSPWSPPGMTSIDGGLIRTGEIRSNSTLDINGVILPTWSINTLGAAQFGDLLIRGDATVGTHEDEADGSHIKSFNYNEGEQGWIIRSDGYAEFRQMAADSIEGQAIKADSLEVNRLSSGDMDASIELLGSISAHGVLGEEVTMSADGFSVYGPDEVNVTNKALTTNIATLTTSDPHGMSVGAPIIVEGVGAPFDGQFDISSVTSTTVSYSLVNADIASTAVNGILKGKDATGTNIGPRYIHFPTDGTQPNIISGKLTADALVVQQGASLRGETVIEQGAALVISHKQVAPKASPTISFNYSDTEVAGLVGNKKDMVFGHNGNLFILTNHNAGDTWRIYEYNPTSGSKVGSEVLIETGLNSHAHGLTYYNNQYYVTGYVPGRSPHYFMRVYDTSFTQVDEVSTDVLGPDWPILGTAGIVAPSGWTNGRLGWDHTNNRIIAAWVDSAEEINIRYYTIDGSGIPTGPAGSAITLPNTSGATEVAGVVRGSLDFGADRLVIRNQHVGSTTVKKNVMVFNSSHVYQSSESWPMAYSQTSKGFDWSPTTSKFYDLSGSNFLKEYFTGDSVWTSGNGDRWLSYTWYRSANSDSDGSNSAYETDPSPAVKVYLPKRSRIQVTTSPIPKGPTNSEQTPDKARVYLSASTSNTPPATSDTSWHLRSEITHPGTTVNIDPYGVLTDPGPPITNGFLALGGDDPAQITSSSGDTYWRGDGEAKMFKLILTSTSDVNASAGNEPPLRIGDIAATHTRFDGNEIQGMVGDATPGLLGLNHSGGAVTINGGAEGSITLGFNSRSFKRIAFGHHNTNSNASGLTTTNHGLGATPTLVLCTPTGAGVTRAIMWRPGTTDSTSFEAEHASLADGTYLTNTAVDFSWVAVVL